jgi:hypothetical protein
MGHYGVVAAQLAGIWGRERTHYAVNVRWPGDPPLPVQSVLPVFTLSMNEASRVRCYGRLAAYAIRALEEHLMIRRGRRIADGWDERIWPKAAADASSASSLHTRDLRHALAVFEAGPEDRVVVPQADAELTLAVVEMLEKGNPLSQSGISVRVTYGDVRWRSTNLTRSSVLQRLTRVPDAAQRIRLFAETRAFARVIEDATDWPVGVVPHPTSILGDYSAPVRRDSGRFVIIVPGQPNPEKNMQHIEPVIVTFANRFPALAARTILRVQTPVPVGRLVAVEVLPRHLDQLAYARALSESNVALLLHDPEAYALRSSGVVCDAVAARLPFICRVGSSLTEWITDGNGIAAADPNSIATALETIANNPSIFRAGSDRAVARLAAALSPPILGVDE